MDGDTTFEELGFAILREYQIISDHLFLHPLSNWKSGDIEKDALTICGKISIAT